VLRIFLLGSSRIFVLSGGPVLEEKEEGAEIDNNKELQEKEGKMPMEEEKLREEDEQHKFYEKDPIYWLEKYFIREGASMDFKFTKTVDGTGLGLTTKKKARSEEEGGANWICSIE
jgi:hypothetical protein